MAGLMTLIDVTAIASLLLLIVVGIHFWLYGERTEVHEEEKIPSAPEDGQPEEPHTSDYD